MAGSRSISPTWACGRPMAPPTGPCSAFGTSTHNAATKGAVTIDRAGRYAKPSTRPNSWRRGRRRKAANERLCWSLTVPVHTPAHPLHSDRWATQRHAPAHGGARARLQRTCSPAERTCLRPPMAEPVPEYSPPRGAGRSGQPRARESAEPTDKAKKQDNRRNKRTRTTGTDTATADTGSSSHSDNEQQTRTKHSGNIPQHSREAQTAPARH